MENTKKFKELDIRLTREEKLCILEIIEYLDVLREFEKLGFSIPDGDYFQPLKEIYNIYVNEKIHISRFTKEERKYQNLPLHFINKIIFTAFIHPSIKIDNESMEVLLKLGIKIGDKLKINKTI